MVEWQCARCGNEDATDSHDYHSWRRFGGLSLYQATKKAVPIADDLQQMHGDLCDECVVSLVHWWFFRRPLGESADEPVTPPSERVT